MQLVILGPVTVLVDGRPVHIDRAQRRAVLAYLLLRANQAVTTDQLIDALWGPAPPATAKRQIFAAVSALRRALRDAGHDPITSTGGAYRVTATADQLDLLAFGHHRDQADQFVREGHLESAVAALRAGLRRWGGTPLGGVSGFYVEHSRSQLEDQRLAARETLAELELDLGNHHAVVTEIADLVAAHPFREKLAGLLMLALYRSGRPADALAAYRGFHRVLSDELGIEPGAAITTLHDRILKNDSALSGPPKSAPSRRFLPRDIPDFTGRAAELQRLDALLAAAPDGTDVVVVSAVVGVGGIGKTALAVHWAHRIAPRFPDGQLYLDLRGYDDRQPLPATEALGAVLRALGTPPNRIPTDVDEAAALYRATLADQRVLILLDNAASVAQVRPLLPSAPGTLVLVTSRDALGGLVARDGARSVNLDLLPLADAVDLLTRLLGADRVAADGQATADLVAACGHLPLALRIAAANLAAQPAVSIAAHVRDLLGGRRLGALVVDGDPQSSMRTIFDQSYRRLVTTQQRAFRLLGCLPGPDCTAAAAAALLDQPAEATLRALTEAHLVVEHRPGRFTMHDLVREFARELAGAPELRDERAGALARLMSWTVAGAEAAAAAAYPARTKLHEAGSRPVTDTEAGPSSRAGLLQAAAHPAKTKLPEAGPGPQFQAAADAKEWLTAELANLIAVVETGAALGDPEAVWRLVFACQPFFNATIERATMLSMGRAAMAAAAISPDPRARAAAELVMAHSYTTNGYDDRVLPHARRCLELAQEIGWRELEVDAHNALSVYHLLTGDLRSAAEHARAAFDQSMAMGIEPPQYLGKLGLIDLLMGSLDTASDYFTRTLASSNHLSGYSRAITQLNLAEVRTLQGRPAEAEHLLDAAITQLREVGNAHVTALAQADLAVVRYHLGRPTEGWDLLAQARAALADSTDVLARAQLSGRHAHLLTAAGRYAEAVDVLEQSLQETLPYGNQHPTTQILIALAEAYATTDRDKAADVAARAVDAARKGQFRLLEGQALHAVARAHLLAGRQPEARRAAHAARRIHRATGHRPGLLETERLLDEIRRTVA